MNSRTIRSFSLLLLAAAGLFSGRCAAQSPVDPGQLPARTSFYLLWRGTPAGEIRRNNSLYALWDDPDFSPARSAFMEAVLPDASKENAKPSTTPKKDGMAAATAQRYVEGPKISREELAQYASLLDNAFLIGYLRRPETPPAAKIATGKETPAWNGMFLVYDRTGKEELLSKAVMHMRGAEKDVPNLANLTVAGVAALKITRKDGVTFWAEFGKYAVSANEQGVFEEILNVLNGKPAKSSLSQSPAYQEAKPLLSGGVLEFFLGVPSVKDLPLDSPGSPASQFKPFLNALKLESVHSLAGHVTIEGAKTRFSAAILGDTAPGGLFDVWADGQAKPLTLAYLSPDTVYYSESQINLLGLYNTIKHAISQAGPNTSQTTSVLESAAQTRLGMPLPDALGLTTGEIASMQNSPTLEDGQKVYFLGLSNKPDALKLARSILGDQITSERNEGTTTFLKISLRGGQGSSGVAQWNFYHLALTPNLLLGSAKSETLHNYLAQGSAGTEVALPKNILEARGQYPDKLNGFSYLNFQKIDWAGLKTKSLLEINKAAQGAKSTDAAHSQKHVADWLSQVNPEVFPRHLHTMSGASWKDAKGVHFDEWLD
jgi:hypothetical protein